MNKVCVIGSINIDMVTTTPRIPLLGETISGQGFMTAAGGKGANAAVAAARLGADVTMLGCVGNDSFGAYMLDSFRRDGINTDAISVIPDVGTGTATILVCGGDNLIILNEGANACMLPGIAEKSRELIAAADIIMLQNEIPSETNRAVFSLAKGMVLYNPAPSASVIPDYLYSADILVVNEHECGDILGTKTDSREAAMQGALALAAKGIKHVIVTLGGEGSVYTDSGKVYSQDAVRVENIIDTTAAGDCFCGAVAKVMSCGGSIHDAIKFATAASSITVTKKGAQPSIPTEAQVIAFRKERSI